MEPARNFAIEKATGDWILLLDPDERIEPSFGKRIRKLVQAEEVNYYRVPRKNIVFGKWMRNSRWWPDYNIRLFRKGTVTWNKDIHSVPLTVGNGVELASDLKHAIVHLHYESIEQYIERMNRYTTQNAKNKIENGEVFIWREVISKPVSEFLSRYFFGKGYKDGFHGLAVASLQAFSEMVVILKMWQMKGFAEIEPDVSRVVKEIEIAQKEVNYWKADALVSVDGGIINRIKRKFKIG